MTQLREKLAGLAELSGRLEPDLDTRSTELASVVDYTESYLQAEDTRRAYRPETSGGQVTDELAFSDSPGQLTNVLRTLDQSVISSGTNTASGEFFAFIPSGSLYESALADFIAAVTNRYAGVGFSAPGASRLEQSVIRWLAKLMGYPDDAQGDLTSGGSIAALSAMLTAKKACGISSRNVTDSVIYLTSHTHHCILKALRIVGLDECIIREVRCDDEHRMLAEALADSIANDRKSGLNPWLVIATAGTTDTGAVDPLEAIADIAEANELWLHVDAAYGGAFMLCEEGRQALRGIERSDSLMFDPHKGFFLPFGTGAVLVRNGEKLYRAFHGRGTYMRDVGESDLRSACDYSPELTRPFRGLRLWLPFKIHGIAPFRAAVQEKLLLARYFHQRISELEGFVVGPKPHLSIVTFRYLPDSGDAEAFNQAFFEQLRDDGHIFLTTTVVGGHLTLRMAILASGTHIESVDLALDVLQKKARQLTAEFS